MKYGIDNWRMLRAFIQERHDGEIWGLPIHMTPEVLPESEVNPLE